jgi:hypothetical protein
MQIAFFLKQCDVENIASQPRVVNGFPVENIELLRKKIELLRHPIPSYPVRDSTRFA